MPLRVNIPLPGPFSYSARIGGGRKRPAKPMTPAGAVLTLICVLMFAITFIVQMFKQPTSVSVVMGLIGVGVIGIFIWLGWAFVMDVRDARRRATAPPPSPPFYSQWPGETVSQMHARWAQLVQPEHRAAFVAMLAQQHAAGQSPPRQRSAPQPLTRPRPTRQPPQ